MRSTPFKLKNLPDAELINGYAKNNRAVSKLAKKYGVSVQALYYRLKQLKIKRRTNSESHFGIPAWNKANGNIDSAGYRVRWYNGKQVREHRIIAEQMLGRALKQGEVMHHKNGNRQDNNPKNLEIYASPLKACGVEV